MAAERVVNAKGCADCHSVFHGLRGHIHDKWVTGNLTPNPHIARSGDAIETHLDTLANAIRHRTHQA
jgi:hypothetical protein